MQVSVETLKGLERKVTVSVPAVTIEKMVDERLREVGRKAKVDGFRPGKVPAHVVKNRFSDSVLLEVARETMNSTLFEALKKEDLNPAGMPAVEPEPIESGKDFRYTATFEVFPEINIKELDKDKIEVVKASVTDADITSMFDKLREQHKEFKSVSRAVAKGDKVMIDFKGFLGEEAFQGGEAEGYEIVIGSGAMIPGFEDGIIGGKKGKPFDIKVTFPADYGHAELAGKEATFNIKIQDIQEGQLPELNDAFAEKFNIKDGGIDALTKDIKENMERELERRMSSMNRDRIFEALRLVNEFDLPTALIDQEIEHLKHDMYHRLFGHEHSDNEQIPDFPRVLFEDQAKRRVHLGLLFSEYVKKHAIVADSDRVKAMIEKFASAYEKPEELRAWYEGSKERLAEIEALVMEEMVAEKISATAKLVNKAMSYDEVMNPKKDTESKGE